MLSSFTWGEYDISTESIANKEFNFQKLHTNKRRDRLVVKERSLFLSVVDNLQYAIVDPMYSSHTVVKVDWKNLPACSHPAGGLIPKDRIFRKTVQVENMLSPVIALIHALTSIIQSEQQSTIHLTIVEFCAGSGYVLLPLAAMFPYHSFILIDNKAKSIAIARARVQEANLKNVIISEDDIENFHDVFDIGISLHACGGATDVSIKKCVASNAAFVSCPCCIGKIISSRTKPLSSVYGNLLSQTSQLW